MVIAPHFEEYAYLMARGVAENCVVTLVLDTGILRSEFEGRIRPTAARVTLRTNRFRSLADALSLIADIVRFQPQVIHWQEPSGLVKAMMAALIVTLCRPFVTLALTIHDPVPHSGRDERVAWRLAPFRRYTRRRVHRLFVHGHSCRDQYLFEYLNIQRAGRPRIIPGLSYRDQYLLPHPPVLRLDDRLALTEHGVILTGETDEAPPGPFHALMFGRMERYKGLGILCDAVETLARDGFDFPLHVAGTGPELDALDPRFRRRPTVRVDNRFIAAADLVQMIQAADCIVLPYTSATQSGVLAAAFGNGRFVVASRVGGMADIVEHGVNGLLVPPGNAAALADVLRMVATDEGLRERLREGARRTAAERLDWSRIGARLVCDYAVSRRRWTRLLEPAGGPA